MRRQFAVITDQALSSASNFLLVLMVVRSMPTAAFGTFAIAFAVLTMGIGLTRASVGVPVSTDLHGLANERRRDLVARSLAVSLALSAVVGLAVASLAFVLGSGATTQALLALAAAAPVVFVQDLGRYALIADGRPGRAVVSDGVWTLASLLALLWSFAIGPIEPAAAVVLWLVGAFVGMLLVISTLAQPRWRHTPRWFASDRRRWHLALDALVGAGTPLAVMAGVSWLTGTGTVGILRGASTLMTPMNVLIAAVGVGVLADAARRERAEAHRFIVWVTLCMVLASAAWGLLLLLLPDSVGRMLIGPTWSVAHAVLPLTIVEFVALAVWTGAITLLRVRNLTARALRVRMAYAIAGITLAVAAAAAIGTALSVQAGLAAAASLVAILAWLVVPRALHR